MRRVRYNVASSLDGFIAGPGGDYSWIPNDPTVDFAALFARVDTIMLGRATYEMSASSPQVPWSGDMRVHVCSRTLAPGDHPAVVVEHDAVAAARRLRHEPGDGEIWLFGGGSLFQSLLEGGQVDTVEVTVVPVVLGGGVPLAPPGVRRTSLRLTGTREYPSGMVTLGYAVADASQ